MDVRVEVGVKVKQEGFALKVYSIGAATTVT
jgi:hypothetical protein